MKLTNCIICDKKLRSDNEIGTCRKHRALSPTRREYENSWKASHKEQYTASKRRWSKKHPGYFVNWRNSRISNKIAHSLRVRLRRAVKSGSAVRNLGCTISELLVHLSSKFVDGMSWENYGKWHIDHILPLSSFDLTIPDQLVKACHYTNLQPLWAEDNLRKNDSLEYYPKSA